MSFKSKAPSKNSSSNFSHKLKGIKAALGLHVATLSAPTTISAEISCNRGNATLADGPSVLRENVMLPALSLYLQEGGSDSQHFFF